MEAKARRREEARREAEQWKVEVACRQALHDVEKRHKLVEEEAHATDAYSKELFRQQWTTDAIKEVGERLQRLIKNPSPLPPYGSCIAPSYGYLPTICKENMARRLAKCCCKKFGSGNPSNILPPTPPTCVYNRDPQYIP